MQKYSVTLSSGNNSVLTLSGCPGFVKNISQMQVDNSIPLFCSKFIQVRDAFVCLLPSSFLKVFQVLVESQDLYIFVVQDILLNVVVCVPCNSRYTYMVLPLLHQY
jgi:hypothetical protein